MGREKNEGEAGMDWLPVERRGPKMPGTGC